MAITAVLMASLFCLPAPPLVFSNDVRITGSAVTLGDVVDISVLPEGLRLRASEVLVARVRNGDQNVPSQVMSVRARRAIPALANWLSSDAGHDVRIVANAQEPLPSEPRPRARAFPTEIEIGDRLTVVVRVGPVEIEREVQALQAARPGEALFVRTANGQVLTAQVESRP